MKCPKCGMENKDSASMCSSCYFNLQSDRAPVKQEQIPPPKQNTPPKTSPASTGTPVPVGQPANTPQTPQPQAGGSSYQAPPAPQAPQQYPQNQQSYSQPGYAQQPPQGAPQYPYGQPAPYPGQQQFFNPVMNYAGFWSRFAAAIVDGFLLILITAAIAMAMGVSFIPDYQNMRQFSSPEAMAARSIVNTISFIISVLYQVGMNTAFGATLGKMAIGLKIVKADGTPAGFGSILVRFIMEQILATVTCCLMYISVATNGEHRGWHDKIAGTSVIHTR